MFRAIFSPITRSTWLYLQYLVVFTQVAAGWCLEWVETELCGLWAVYTCHTIHIVQYQLIRDISRQQLVWTLPDTVNRVKCSWWWTKISPETCRAGLEEKINLYIAPFLVIFMDVSRCTNSWTSSSVQHLNPLAYFFFIIHGAPINTNF